MTSMAPELNLWRPLLDLLPEVASPAGGRRPPTLQKAVNTAVVLGVFLAGSRQPLYVYGIDHLSTTAAAAAGPLYWVKAAVAVNFNTVMAFGVYPLLASEVVLHVLFGFKVFKFRSVSEERSMWPFTNELQKLVAILISMALTTEYVLSEGIASQYGTWNAVLVALQLLSGSAAIVYLDQFLRKGYGLVSSRTISLFSSTNICASLWEAYGVRGGGNVVPMTMKRIIGTCVFSIIVMGLQGLHIKLPVRVRGTVNGGDRAPGTTGRQQITNNYAVDLSYLSYAPIIFHGILVSATYSISQMLYVRYGENDCLVVNLLGKWELRVRDLHYGQLVPVSGVAYYLTTPPTLGDVARDPVHAMLHAALMIMGCAFMSVAWFRVRVYSTAYEVRLLGGDGQVRVTPSAQAGWIPVTGWKPRVAEVAFLVGSCVGALAVFAGLVGVGGSAVGIMLVVNVVYSYFQGRGEEGVAGAGALFGL